MINIDEYINKLQQLQDNIPKYVDALAFSYLWDIVIITDVKIPFPKNYELVKHGNQIEISDKKWDEREGCGKPDKIFGGVEIKYLWKQFKPKSILNIN